MTRVATSIVATAPPTVAVSAAIDKNATAALLATISTIIGNRPPPLDGVIYNNWQNIGYVICPIWNDAISTADAASRVSMWIVDQYGVDVYLKQEFGPFAIAIGKYGMSPKQLENAGVLKRGSAALIMSLINVPGVSLFNNISVPQAMTPNLFTGLFGVTSIESFVQNLAAQSSAMIANLRQAQASLRDSGVLSGKEDPTQIAGLVLSAATIGVSATTTLIGVSRDIDSHIYASYTPGQLYKLLHGMPI